jgi:hypothetical protein
VLTGVIDVSGGKGGVFHDRTARPTPDPPPDGVKTIGGDGGGGYVRIEAARQTARDVGTVIPPIDQHNLGVLDEQRDPDLVTGAQSLWYRTDRLFPPEYVRYVIEAEVGGVRRVFSDDPGRGVPAVLGQSPIAFFLQSAQVDSRSEPDPFTLSRWLTTTNQINLERGNGFRFLILFDRGILGPGESLEVKKITVDFKG